MSLVVGRLCYGAVRQNVKIPLRFSSGSGGGSTVAKDACAVPQKRLPRPKHMRHYCAHLFSTVDRMAPFVCLLGGIIIYFVWNKPHYERNDRYYRDYDIEEHFHSMRNKGLFQWCDPDPK